MPKKKTKFVSFWESSLKTRRSGGIILNMMKVNTNMTEQEWMLELADRMKGRDGHSEMVEEPEMLCEMANFLHTRHTELPSNIWISMRNANRGPRIKIQRNKGNRMQDGETFSMTISDSPSTISPDF